MRKLFMTLTIIFGSFAAVSAQTTQGFETKSDGQKVAVDPKSAKPVTVNKQVTNEKSVKTDAKNTDAAGTEAKAVGVENVAPVESAKFATSATSVKPVTKVVPANSQKASGISDKRSKENRTKNKS